MITRGTLNVRPVNSESYSSAAAHEEIQNKECVVLECEVGKRAWIAVKVDNDEINPWHRIHTSEVKSIDEPNMIETLCCMPPIHIYKINIVTENSVYTIEERIQEKNPVITKLC